MEQNPWDEAIKILNDASTGEARALLTRCCGSRRWVDAMLQNRPFRSRSELFEAASRNFEPLEQSDWDEAFSHHPRIGAPHEIAEKALETSAWAASEQARVAQSTGDIRAALAEGNRAYEARFGRIYLVCATGKTGDELLAILRARLDNDPEEELRIAANEQKKITFLRLEKLFSP